MSLPVVQLLDMTVPAWHNLYSDLPSKMIKLPVPDKDRIVCTSDETAVVSPAGLQADLAEAMALFAHGRCFVRPSGTEDVVRVYAEASTMAEVDILLEKATAIIDKHLRV